MIKLGARFRKTLYCSFCGKSQHEVRKLVAGVHGFICDECVSVCVKVLDEGDSAPKASVSAPHRVLDRVRAWFAGLRRSDGNSHFVGVLR